MKAFKSVQKIRLAIQVTIVIVCIWIGIEFYSFVKFLETAGAQGSFYRPPGVEGFLPISSLMNFLYFLKTGDVHSVHYAGFFIFSAIVLMSFFAGKSFCSWICPVGFFSEKIADLGQKIFKRKIKLPKYLDYVLRSIKYLLLLFLLFLVIPMDASDLYGFLSGDYNVIADVKMYYFFAQMTFVSFVVISVLIALSFVFRGFWCRYLCPYGAFLGLVGLLSPNKIMRNKETCIDCSKCSKVCPSFIKVDKISAVISDECTSCLKCIESCPVKNTLTIQAFATKKQIPYKVAAAIIIIIYLSVIALGPALNKWDNQVTKDEYFRIFKMKDNLQHH